MQLADMSEVVMVMACSAFVNLPFNNCSPVVGFISEITSNGCCILSPENMIQQWYMQLIFRFTVSWILYKFSLMLIGLHECVYGVKFFSSSNFLW